MTIKDNARGRMLLEAHRCVNQDRNAAYGDPNQDFKRTAGYWNIHLGGILDRKLMEAGLDGNTIPPEFRAVLDNVFETWDVAIMQGFVKKSRLAWSPGKLDSWIDDAGYDACGVDCITAAGLVSMDDLPFTDEHVTDPPPIDMQNDPVPEPGPVDFTWPIELDPFNAVDVKLWLAGLPGKQTGMSVAQLRELQPEQFAALTGRSVLMQVVHREQGDRIARSDAGAVGVLIEKLNNKPNVVVDMSLLGDQATPDDEPATDAVVLVDTTVDPCEFEHPHPSHPCGRRIVNAAPAAATLLRNG